MAYDPCDCHAQRFRGKSVYAYPAEISLGQRTGGRVRLCPSGAASFCDWASKHLDEISDGVATTTHEQPVCGLCGELGPTEPVSRLYLTLYPDHKTRHDYSGWACARCATQARSAMLLTFSLAT